MPPSCQREAYLCLVHWRNCSIHLCGNVPIVKGWGAAPEIMAHRFALLWDSWAILASFYFFLIMWCRLIAVIFPSFVFSWAWVNSKFKIKPHISLSKCRNSEECVLGWYLFLEESCWWSEPLILALRRGIKFSHPQETTHFCYVTCSTSDRRYRAQNWGQQNTSISTLHNKTFQSWSGKEYSKDSCWFSFGFWSNQTRCQMGWRFCLVGKF